MLQNQISIMVSLMLWDWSIKYWNNRFSNARQSVRHYEIFTGHFKTPLDIMPGNPVNS